MLRRLPARSLIPALVLAALVLAVFSQLQNYGPESAVRRFHEALLTNNESEVEDVLFQPADPVAVANIANRIYPWFLQGAHIRLRDLQRNPTTVFVSVVYHTPDNKAGYYVWVTEKTPTGWKVDASATWRLWHHIAS